MRDGAQELHERVDAGRVARALRDETTEPHGVEAGVRRERLAERGREAVVGFHGGGADVLVGPVECLLARLLLGVDRALVARDGPELALDGGQYPVGLTGGHELPEHVPHRVAQLTPREAPQGRVDERRWIAAREVDDGRAGPFASDVRRPKRVSDVARTGANSHYGDEERRDVRSPHAVSHGSSYGRWTSDRRHQLPRAKNRTRRPFGKGSPVTVRGSLDEGPHVPEGPQSS